MLFLCGDGLFTFIISEPLGPNSFISVMTSLGWLKLVGPSLYLDDKDLSGMAGDYWAHLFTLRTSLWDKDHPIETGITNSSLTTGILG